MRRSRRLERQITRYSDHIIGDLSPRRPETEELEHRERWPELHPYERPLELHPYARQEAPAGAIYQLG